MNVLARFALAALLGGAALAAAVPLAPPAAGGTPAEEAVADFKAYLETKPDSQGIRNKIADLALKKDPVVADALLPLLQSPRYDDDVKIAVAQNIGKQGKPSIAGVLVAMAGDKKYEEKPKILAALLEGIGDCGAKANYDFLMKTAKAWLDKNADVACAGYRAAANYVTPDTVDDLIKELARADYTTNQDNAVKRAARGAAKPVLVDLLKKVTGKDISDVKIWQEWWGREKKTWKPPIAGKDKPKDLNASDTFSDDAYAFEVKKPGRTWVFRRSDQGPYLVVEAMDEGQRAAWCELFIMGTKNYSMKSPSEWAKSMKDQIEPKFRDIKEGVWDQKCLYGGKKGVEQIVKGQHKDFDAIQMHNVFIEQGEVMYYWICVWKSGKPQGLRDNIDEILKSFRINR